MFSDFMNLPIHRSIIVETKHDYLNVGFHSASGAVNMTMNREDTDKFLTLLSRARADMQEASTKELVGETIE
jgi:hypothetical protein